MNQPDPAAGAPASPSFVRVDVVGTQVSVSVNDMSPAMLATAIGEQVAMSAAGLVRVSQGVVAPEEALRSVLRAAAFTAQQRLPIYVAQQGG